MYIITEESRAEKMDKISLIQRRLRSHSLMRTTRRETFKIGYIYAYDFELGQHHHGVSR